MNCNVGSTMLWCGALHKRKPNNFLGSHICAVAKIDNAVGGTKPLWKGFAANTTLFAARFGFIETAGFCVRDCNGKPGAGQACVLQASGGDGRSPRTADKTPPAPRGLAVESPYRRARHNFKKGLNA